MTCDLVALNIDATDPEQLARFWAGVLRWEATDDTTLLPPDDSGFRLRFLPTDQPKTGPNQIHFDLTSTTHEVQAETVARALSLGGQHLDIGQLPEEDHVVLGDPDGNEFCVIEPGNNFLAGCPFIGALSCDGTQAVGYFWSAALGWPLVWDQDEETAIRSPQGGPKVSWGGPPLAARTGRNRLRFELAPTAGSDLALEVDRLLAVGASRLGSDYETAVLADPDGNEFSVRPSLS